MSRRTNFFTIFAAATSVMVEAKVLGNTTAGASVSWIRAITV